MAVQETEIIGEDVGPLRKQYNLFLGVWSQFWYVGAQVAIAGYFINYCKEAGKTSAQGCKSLISQTPTLYTKLTPLSRPPCRGTGSLCRKPLYRRGSHDNTCI